MERGKFDIIQTCINVFRSHTIILVDNQNRVYFRENRMQDDPPANVRDAKWETSELRFQLE